MSRMLSVGLNGCEHVRRDLYVAGRGVSRVPTPVRLGGIDVTLPGGLHASFLHEVLDLVAVDLRPPALGTARREALQVGVLVEALANAVDPPPAKRDVDRLRGRDARPARRLLEDLGPDFFLLVVTLRKPRLERGLACERADRFRIDEHGVFPPEQTSTFSSRRLGCSR